MTQLSFAERRAIVQEARKTAALLLTKLESLAILEEEIAAIVREGSHEVAEGTQKDDRSSFGITSFGTESSGGSHGIYGSLDDRGGS